MERSIVGFRRDEHDDWVAELSCGHAQHVRHRPPFELRPWVLDDATRNATLGTGRDCPLCDVERGGETACYAHSCARNAAPSSTAAGTPPAATAEPERATNHVP